MLTLFYSPGAASLVVHWLLIELDVVHELRLLDFEAREQKSPEYLKLNPNGVVPTLLIDGEPVFEAAALVLHLADSYPAAGLAPPLGTVRRAHYYQWILHLADTLQPAFRNWFYPSEAAGEANAEATREAARVRVEASWDRIESHLAEHGPWLLGESLSAADFHLTMLMRWSRNMPKPATEWPNLARLAARMKERPSFKLLYEREKLTEWA
ncbi:MAG: glutathione S-transferase family protein [Arenimonas sp.]